MMLIEQTTVPLAALPIAGFRDHLRLGTGFADDGVQDGVLEASLRAAIAAIEGRTGKILIERAFLWRIEAWRGLGAEALPVAPVGAVTALRIHDAAGIGTLIDPARYRFVPDEHRPRIEATGACLPSIPEGGHGEIEFTAGYAPDWGGLPADLGQAVMLLAAHYYEHRHAGQAPEEGEMPFGVSALIERYRTVRILGGRRG